MQGVFALSKVFLTYDQQIDLLKSKHLTIEDETVAKFYLKRYSYYSLISGYKDIFKLQKNGDYKPDASFNKIHSLYTFDDYLRNLILHEIFRIEKHIKSLYSYSFCELYGDEQKDFQNVNNYDYKNYQNDINTFMGKISDTITHSSDYPYVDYNIRRHGSVPLWVMINTFTFGTLSKMYMFSTNKLQSRISKEFPNIYPQQLSSMLTFLTKFRNVCAHGERLYNYKTRKAIPLLPVHALFPTSRTGGKNDLFSVLVCFKYLSLEYDFQTFVVTLDQMLKFHEKQLGTTYITAIMSGMGFPANWKDILK